MTPLGLGSSIEEPWGGLVGGGGSVAFLGGGIALLGGLGGPVPYLLPCLEDIADLTCLGAKGMNFADGRRAVA